MPPTHNNRALPHPKRPARTLATLALCALTLPACTPKPDTRHPKPDTHHPIPETPLLLDFEKPNPPVLWTSAPTTQPSTQPSTQPAVEIARSSLRPNTGLWSLRLTLPPQTAGTLRHTFPAPIDLHAADTLQLAVMHTDNPTRSASFAAAVTLTDASGTSATGDFYPIFSRWQNIPLDLPSLTLATGDAPPIDLTHIASMGMVIKPLGPATHTDPRADQPLEIQTDSWAARSDSRPYFGQRLSPPNTFYAQRRGSRILVGITDSYELTFADSSTFANPNAPPFLSVTHGPNHRTVLGQPHTGLSILSATALADLNLHNSPAEAPSASAAALGLGTLNVTSAPFPTPWPAAPGGGSTISWECTWASPVAVIIEGKQQVAPFDRLSRPAATLTWRFMVYQWGQVFVHVDWSQESDTLETPIPNPASWVLALDSATLTSDPSLDARSPDDAQRLLAALYPTAFRNNVTLPHQMQPGAPVALLAKTSPQMPSPWWWARLDCQKFFGTGIASPPAPAQHSPLNAMLLVNAPAALTQAGSFSQYLQPPRLQVRQGELDRNFPGDTDNDGFVEPYGFQVIRLANGRAAFTVYPDNRPLFYPPILFTIPAVERATLDLPHARLLINIDGKQFADPPQFPDGSFLLQLPYTLDRPVSIEAVLIKR